MKDEYLKAYQHRIEEIKLLDVSPKEKRKLAADAKNEILDQYKASYIKEKEEAVEEDVIGDIINKLEEREERGEVGIDLDSSTEFMDPESLFSVMDADELFSSLGLEDEDNKSDGDKKIDSTVEESFVASDDLFAKLLDEVEDEIISNKANFENETTKPNDVENEIISNKVNFENETTKPNDVENEIISNKANFENETTKPNDVAVPQTEDPSSPITKKEEAINNQISLNESSIETDVEEIEEIVEGSILTDDELESETTNELGKNRIRELRELEKERERAQKIGAIEIILLIVLIILVIIVVYLIIGV